MSRRRKNPQGWAMVREQERQAKKEATPEVAPKKLNAFSMIRDDLELLKRSALVEEKNATFYSDILSNILNRALNNLWQLDPRPVDDSDIPF